MQTSQRVAKLKLVNDAKLAWRREKEDAAKAAEDAAKAAEAAAAMVDTGVSEVNGSLTVPGTEVPTEATQTPATQTPILPTIERTSPPPGPDPVLPPAPVSALVA